MSEIEGLNSTISRLPEMVNNGILASSGVKTAVRYCLYARKSSEDDERQALSIDSQIKEMTSQAESDGLLVTDIRRESHSAKDSGTRPVFTELIQDIRKGIFQGILTWAPDRLSRNAGDLGTIVDLMDNGFLKEIKTHGQTLTNSPNDKFLLMILCSQAKLENDHRGENVKRGMKTKCELGFRPNQTPLGYLNDPYSIKGQKKVYWDPVRAPIIKQAFEKVAFESFSGRDIYEWMKNEANFATRSGKFMNLSSIYKMLNNPYYCGMFEYPTGSGKWYKGAYEPIISRELFNKVQDQLAVHPKTRPNNKEFDFTRIFKCGCCDSGITALEKFKNTKKGKKRYIYYLCTQFKDFDCREPYIRQEQAVKDLIEILSKNLTMGEIRQKSNLSEKMVIYNRFSAVMMGKNVMNEENSLETTQEGFVRYILEDGTREEKRELVGCLDKTLYIKNKRVTIDP